MKHIPRFECKLVRSGTEKYDAKSKKITSSEDAMHVGSHLISRMLADSPQERFGIITLDTKGQMIGVHVITVGTLDASLVHPREVFRPAMIQNASRIILFHNHPSGDTTPSADDYSVMRRLQEAGSLLGIEVIDSIIVGANALSMAEYEITNPC